MKRHFYLLILTLFSFSFHSCEKNTVTEPKRSSAKEILSINFYKSSNGYLTEDIVASKTGSDFKANLPQGLSLTNLSAVLRVSEGTKIQFAGQTYESMAGEVVLNGDYSKPVDLTIIAEDESQMKYKLTVISAPFSSEKEIISLIIKAEHNNSIAKDIVGQISGSTIRVTVPSGTYVALNTEVKLSDFSQFMDSENKAIPLDKPFSLHGVDPSNGKESKTKFKVRAQDKTIHEYEIIVNSEKGKPQDIFENSNSSRLSSIFFTTGQDAEVIFFTSPLFVTFQYNTQGKIEKVRYYGAHNNSSGEQYFSYLGMDKYDYKTNTVDIIKTSKFYETQDHGRLTAEMNTNGYPKNIKFTFSSNANTFYANYQYNSSGNLTREEGKGDLFDAGSVFEDLTQIPFDTKYEYSNGNMTKATYRDGNTSIYTYYLDKNSNDGWAQGLINLGTDALNYQYYVKAGKPSKNLLKEVHDPNFNSSLHYTYKFDSSNRVKEMRVTSTENDHFGQADEPAIVEFNYPK